MLKNDTGSTPIVFTIHELTSKMKNCTEGKNKVKIIGIGGLVTVMITIAICGTIFGTFTNKAKMGKFPHYVPFIRALVLFFIAGYVSS